MGEAKRKKEANLIEGGRLAFRVEGPWWVAYYAMTDTMDNAVPLGQILMSIVQDQQIKAKFMLLMRQAVTTVLKDIGQEVVKWNDPREAPEHEKAGSA